MLALGKRIGSVTTAADVTGSVSALKASASAEVRAATLAASFESSMNRSVGYHGSGVMQAANTAERREFFYDTFIPPVTAGIKDDTSVYLWCNPDTIAMTQQAQPNTVDWSFNSQPPTLEVGEPTYIPFRDEDVDLNKYIIEQYGPYSLVQTSSSLLRTKEWSLTFKGGGTDCDVNNHGAAAGSGYLIQCNVGINHNRAPTVGQRMQYFWKLEAGNGGESEQFAWPCRGYNTGEDGAKLYDVSFEDYNDLATPLQLAGDTAWSFGDEFGISYDGSDVIFTHNGTVVGTLDASDDYVANPDATSHVAFSSHWHLQGTPVYDLVFAAL
jgi:hypothetical protein